MTRTMYDSVTPARVPADAQMVAAYLDSHAGREATPAAMRRRCPQAQIVTITVKGGDTTADVVDCETGDVAPDGAAAWARRMIDAGRHPTIYCNASTWPDVKAAVARLGLTGGVSYWIAHYGQPPVVPAGAVAIQYRNDIAANLDTSAVADYWPGVDPRPVAKQQSPPPPPARPLPEWVPAWYTHVIQPGAADQSIASALKVWGDPHYPMQVTNDPHVQGLLAEIQHVTGEPVSRALTARTAYSIQHWHH